MAADSDADNSDSAPLVSDKVLFLSGDLMFASRVSSAAKTAGLQFQMSGNLPTEPADDVRVVILDLATRSSIVQGFGAKVADACPRAMTIAYGPHVQVGPLESAKAEKLDHVMTRGQFDRQIAGFLQTLAN
ncbi:histidine kinase [Crateriforma spongiae]|uniref:histidine kinase n=1 Tax=Crateriforma spongiae TaxID=2724528 RepID=UPI0014479839|nr:histidine kinase [Crateriforma spongiae]